MSFFIFLFFIWFFLLFWFFGNFYFLFFWFIWKCKFKSEGKMEIYRNYSFWTKHLLRNLYNYVNLEKIWRKINYVIAKHNPSGIHLWAFLAIISTNWLALLFKIGYIIFLKPVASFITSQPSKLIRSFNFSWLEFIVIWESLSMVILDYFLCSIINVASWITKFLSQEWDYRLRFSSATVLSLIIPDTHN